VGAVHDTFADAFPDDAVTPNGTDGTVAGTTVLLTAAVESPAAFVAFTLNVYDVPFVSPEHAAVKPVTTHEPPPGVDVTEYDVIGEPPSDTGADHVMEAEVFPRTAVTDVGAVLTVNGVTNGEAVDAALEPTALEAVTVTVYAVPLVRPVMVQDSGFASTPTVVEQEAPPGEAVAV
jgi:hypothetical protein